MIKNKTNAGRKNRKSGYWAEFLARCKYRLHGWNIICKNYVTGRGTQAGEVDFIAVRRHVLVFVEVKKRASLELAAYAVTAKQQRRLLNAARGFLSKYPDFSEYDIRFDAVLFQAPFSMEVIADAWRDDQSVRLR